MKNLSQSETFIAAIAITGGAILIASLLLYKTYVNDENTLGPYTKKFQWFAERDNLDKCKPGLIEATAKTPTIYTYICDEVLYETPDMNTPPLNWKPAK